MIGSQRGRAPLAPGLTSPVRSFARIWESVFWRFDDLRVERREGFPFESSSTYAAFFAACTDSFRPLLRSVALTPGCAVSTGTSRRGRGGLFGFFGPDRSVQ